MLSSAFENSIRSPPANDEGDDDLFQEDDMGGGDQSIAPTVFKAKDKSKDMFNPASAAARHGVISPNEDIFPEYKNANRVEEDKTMEFNPFKSSEDVAPVVQPDKMPKEQFERQESPKF